jgi:Zn-dependent peptidase ImmA (M78 family)/transcriptional regulator with XRE-family HTH domain
MIAAQIRRYREALGMTVAKLASEIGVSRNTVTNYEAANTEPTASDLVELARVLGCDVSDLLGITKASSPPRFAFRAHAPLRRDPSVIVLARKFLRAYAEVEEITQTRLCDRLRPYSCDLNGGELNERQIEAIAEDVRRNCGIQDCGPENIASVLENLGVRCLFFPFASPGLDGISAIHGDVMLTMLRNSDRHVERIIFSAAHELGHLVLHPFLFSESNADVDENVRYEKEANIFAGSFLVPSNELARIWREDRLSRLPVFHALLLLKRVFHVSYWSLFYRVKALKLTDMDWPAFTAHTKKYMGIVGKAKVSDLEPEPIDSRALYKTTRFELLVRSAFVQDLISVAKVAEMLQVSVEEAQTATAKWLRPAKEPRKRKG